MNLFRAIFIPEFESKVAAAIWIPANVALVIAGVVGGLPAVGMALAGAYLSVDCMTIAENVKGR